MRLERIVPGRRPSSSLQGAVLARDLAVAGERWRKGRRLSSADLDAIGTATAGAGFPAAGATVVVPGPDDLHEDEAALRLSAAIVGGRGGRSAADAGLTFRGPSESRVDLVAAVAGVARVRAGALERLARLGPLDPFTVLDGQAVEPGDLVASVKVGPHVVTASEIARGEAVCRGAIAPVVSVAPYRHRRVAALVKETLAPASRARFETSLRTKVEALGCSLVGIRYAGDDPGALGAALAELTRGPGAVDLLLTAGAGGSDPLDPLFLALAAAGGRVVRQGVPAHPGSMLWLGRCRRTVLLGVPSCSAYSKATAVDLVLPWLVAGAPADSATVARLAHGGVLSRAMRFRFPPYARALEAPERGPESELAGEPAPSLVGAG